MIKIYRTMLNALGLCVPLFCTPLLGSTYNPRAEIDPMLVELACDARYAALTVTAPPLLVSGEEQNFWLDFIRNCSLP